MNTPEFRPFPKMPRLSREILITEKIDGTNASILITPGDPSDPKAIVTWHDETTNTDMIMLAGSRTRWITCQDDNHGFANWVYANAMNLRGLGIGHHFGEWWGSGINRGYGITKGEKRFSLFNVARWCLHGQTPAVIPTADPRVVKTQDVLPACCGLVPVLHRGIFDTAVIQATLTYLGATGSQAAPGYMNPEGIVIFHIAGNLGFKKTIEKDEEPKSLHA